MSKYRTKLRELSQRRAPAARTHLTATTGRRGTERGLPIGLPCAVGKFGLSTIAPRGAAQRIGPLLMAPTNKQLKMSTSTRKGWEVTAEESRPRLVVGSGRLYNKQTGETSFQDTTRRVRSTSAVAGRSRQL